MPGQAGGCKSEPELDRLSNIIQKFNDLFRNIEWEDADRVTQLITVELPKKVSENSAHQNVMENSYRQNARIEHWRLRFCR